MTNKEILDAYKGLVDLTNAKVKLSIKVSYILARDKMLLERYAKVIEEKRKDLYIKYGTVTEDGNVKVSYENVSKLNNELNELLEIDNNLELTKVQIEDFGDENIEFGVIESLMALIKTQE